MIYILIYATNQQNNYNIHEMNPTIYILKTLILKFVMNHHCFWSL